MAPSPSSGPRPAGKWQPPREVESFVRRRECQWPVRRSDDSFLGMICPKSPQTKVTVSLCMSPKIAAEYLPSHGSTAPVSSRIERDETSTKTFEKDSGNKENDEHRPPESSSPGSFDQQIAAAAALLRKTRSVGDEGSLAGRATAATTRRRIATSSTCPRHVEAGADKTDAREGLRAAAARAFVRHDPVPPELDRASTSTVAAPGSPPPTPRAPVTPAQLQELKLRRSSSHMRRTIRAPTSSRSGVVS